jgi:hypothetical protein
MAALEKAPTHPYENTTNQFVTNKELGTTIVESPQHFSSCLQPKRIASPNTTQEHRNNTE